MFRIECENPLPSRCRERYSGLAYDGCWLYLTSQSACKILQMDSCFNQTQCFDTCRIYSKICYDPNLNCFWASSDRCRSVIFRLDKCLQEIDSININNPDVCGGVVTGIAYNCCCNMLIISFAYGIICIDKAHIKESATLIKSCGECFMGIVSVCPYIICHCLEKDKKSICIYNHCGKLINKMTVSDDVIDTVIESAVFFPSTECVENWVNCHFYVLISKHYSYPYILDCVLEYDGLCKNICKCNYELCSNRCCCENHCNDKQNRRDIMESIALVEASIAHILNAEGEKIQKVIASTDNICDILEVNKSINKTLIRATNLEQLLYYNIEVLSECCNQCNDNNCDCDYK